MADGKGTQYKKGDIVRILEDEEKVKNLQDCYGGYNIEIKHYLGKVGQVINNVDSHGHLSVQFGDTWFVFNPMCCVPAPGETVYERSDEDVENITLNRTGLNNILMKMMLEGYPVSMPEEESIKYLFTGMLNGEINMVHALLNISPGLVHRIFQDITPLFLASHDGQRSIVLDVLDKGADVDKCNEEGNTPLMVAISRGHSDIGKLLIERGANVNIVNNDGRTALHYAAFADDSNSVKILIGNGCDVNLQDSNGDTTLHCAILTESDAAVAVLCADTNLDPGLINKRGFNILQWASLKNQEIAVDKILDRHMSMVNDKTLDGVTALHVAAMHNHTGCAKLLIEKGNADINNKNMDDHTPLMLAALEGNFECVQLLIEKNADVNAVDRMKRTPLHASCIGRNSSGGTYQKLAGMMGLSLGSDNTDNRINVAKCLIKNGARPDLKDVDGDTPLMCCSDDNMKRILFEFIKERMSASRKSSRINKSPYARPLTASTSRLTSSGVSSASSSRIPRLINSQTTRIPLSNPRSSDQHLMVSDIHQQVQSAISAAIIDVAKAVIETLKTQTNVTLPQESENDDISTAQASEADDDPCRVQ